jgi:hypothetical protein
MPGKQRHRKLGIWPSHNPITIASMLLLSVSQARACILWFPGLAEC